MSNYDYMIDRVNKLAEQKERENQNKKRLTEKVDNYIRIATLVFFILNSVGIIAEIVLLLKILG